MLMKEDAESAASAMSLSSFEIFEKAAETAGASLSGAKANTSATRMAKKANNIAYSLIACPRRRRLRLPIAGSLLTDDTSCSDFPLTLLT